MKSFKPLAVVATLLVLFSPSIGLAALQAPKNNFGLPGGQASTLSAEVEKVVNLFLGVVGLIAVVFLIYGGFRYITSAGNEESAESAKKIISNSIIGLIVIILSYVIVTVVINALRPGGTV